MCARTVRSAISHGARANGGTVGGMAPSARVFPARPLQALGTMLSFTAVLWAVEFYDQLTGQRLDAEGIVPRTTDGLEGVL